MTTAVVLSDRDRSLLRLLSWTSATTPLLLRASSSFDGGPFLDERRLRERLQALSGAGFVRSWSSAHAGGGLQNYYKLTVAGFQAVRGTDVALPPKAFFAEISPSLFEHTLRLAEVIIETVRRCFDSRITILRFHRENDLQFAVGERQVQPDCFFQFASGNKHFNTAFEIDQSTESIESRSTASLRRKLQTYDAYQTLVLSQWRESGRTWERPRLRVVFLTKSIDRAYHILSEAGRIVTDHSRRLVYATTQDAYVGEADALRAPIFLDHRGAWQSLVNLHPSSPFTREPVRLPKALEQMLPI